MVPELRDLMYKDRLKEMGLPALQDRRERDLITLYRIVNGIEKLDKQNPIWNGLKEVVTATNIHKFKEMLDIWRQDTIIPA